MKRLFNRLALLFIIFAVGTIAIVWIGFNSKKETLYNYLKQEIIKDETFHAKERVTYIRTLFFSLKKLGYPKEEIKKILKAYIREFNKKEPNKYIFVLRVYNLQGGKKFAKMVVNPNVKYLEGKWLDSDFEDVKGNKFRIKMLEISRTTKEGLISYFFKNPINRKIEQKFTYIVYIPELKWIVASGVYIDDINSQIKMFEKNLLKILDNIILTLLGFLAIVTVFVYIIYYRVINKIKKEIEFEKRIDYLLAQIDLELLRNNLYPKDLNTLFDLIGVEKFAIFTENKNKIIGEASLKEGEVIKFKNLYFVFYPKVEQKYKLIINHLIFAYYTLIERRNYEKKLENKIEKQLKELKEKDLQLLMQSKAASLGELVGNISHQWKQPLNALQNKINNIRIDIMLGEVKGDKLERDLKEMEDIIQNMNKIIDLFKGFYTTTNKKEVISTSQVFENVFSIFNPGEIGLYIDIEECFFKGELNSLEQVILAILANAKEIFKRRNIKGKIFVRVFCKDAIYIEIEDTAGGIDKDILPKIFDQFFSTKNSSGLGLALSKKIIESLKGEIRVENVVKNGEKGAKFIIKIPRFN